MVHNYYTVAQFNSNIFPRGFPRGSDITSAAPGAIQALFTQFTDCDLGTVAEAHAAAGAIIAPFFSGAATAILQTAVLEHIYKVIESAATEPPGSAVTPLLQQRLIRISQCQGWYEHRPARAARGAAGDVNRIPPWLLNVQT
jgi:hypothetical protein